MPRREDGAVKPPPLEHNAEVRIVAYLTSLPGSKQLKPNMAVHLRGEPDRIGCLQGMMYAFEIKRPGEKPTPLQAVRLDEWRRAGAIVAIVHSAEEVEAALVSAGWDVTRKRWRPGTESLWRQRIGLCPYL